MKKHKFLIGTSIYAIVLIAVVTGLLIWFWGFIEAYEKAMPYNYMDTEFGKFGKETVEEYFDYEAADVDKAFVPREELVDYITSFITEDLEYQEAMENTDKNPVYEIKNGKTTVAKVYFEEAGEDKYGYTTWKLKNYDFSMCTPETHSIEIKALADTTVVVDGVTLTADYITEKDIPAENYDKIKKYTEAAPTYVKYKVDKILGEHEVKATDVNGKELVCTMNESVYEFGWENNDTLQAEVQTHVETVNELYAKFFANSGWSLYNYVLDGSYMEENLDLSTTYFYPSEYISGMAMISREFSEFREYGEECFSCRVNYVFEVYFTGFYTDKEVTNNDMTMIFVKSGDQWLLADFVYN